jgi:outer membrane protein OmpA-like peptidoglycan-associated protein
LEVLADRVHFAYNKAAISKGSAPVLDRIASILRQYPGVNVELQGHADQRGSEAYNQKLAQSRADAVRTYLVAAGVDGKRLNVKSFGKTKLEDAGTSNQAYAKNRRVLFVLSTQDGVQLKSQGEDLQVEAEKAKAAKAKRGGRGKKLDY